MTAMLKKTLRRILPRPVYDRLVSGYWEWRWRRTARPAANVNSKDYWDRIWTAEGLHTRNEAELHAAILELVPADVRVADVGCGNGQLIRKLIRDRRAVCTGVDISSVALEALRRELDIATLQTALPAIPAPDETFDVGICSECLEHLDRPLETVLEMHRIVREGGRLILTVPDGCIWKKGGEHVQEFTPTDCVNLLRPLVRDVHLETLVDANGWPYLIVWGERCRERRRYAADLAPEVR